ncbi:sigma-70 family RNA polymerase sigma factor [Aeromicrobium panaciterrae]|uniref:sigma-70 family RNA polymerase sigma factor n=1 Tax=Aeromicrobium panaciterrae TaxID=363861 RepID=UPI0031E35F1E
MLSTTAESSDADLIAAVRGGDTEAYGLLFERHRQAATRLAGHLVPGPDADDLVSESFARVLAVLQDGKGPDEFFRAYLLSAIRRLHLDRIRGTKRVRTTGDESELDRAVEFVDPTTMQFEHGAAAAAFASLPERWQLVLWHLDVEGQKPAAIAPLLGMSANSVSALAYRAREGLRQAYLQGHLAPTLHEGCRRTTGQLGAYVRKGLSNRDVHAVEAHLDDCSRCTGLYLELSEVNSNLSGILGPAVLGTAATGYLAAASAAAGIGTAVGITGAASQVARVVALPVKAVTAGAAGVAGAGAQGVVAVTVVAGLATAGTVAVATDFGGVTDSTRPAAVSPQTSPVPVTPTETPGLTGLEPGLEPTVEPTPEPTVVPTPEPTETAVTEVQPTVSGPSPDPEVTEQPPPPPPPPAPTDYGIGAVAITSDDTLLQHRYTIGITAATDGPAKARAVTVTMAFRYSTVFRGVVSEGWSCGSAVRNRRLTTLTCTKTLGAGEGATFIAKALGLAQSGTVTVTEADDPNPANNSQPFRAGLWLPL